MCRDRLSITKVLGNCWEAVQRRTSDLTYLSDNPPEWWIEGRHPNFVFVRGENGLQTIAVKLVRNPLAAASPSFFNFSSIRHVRFDACV